MLELRKCENCKNFYRKNQVERIKLLDGNKEKESYLCHACLKISKNTNIIEYKKALKIYRHYKHPTPEMIFAIKEFQETLAEMGKSFLKL